MARDVQLTISDLLGSELNSKTKSLTAQTGDSAASIVESPEAELWGPLGYAARPAKAKPGEHSAQSVCVRMTDYDLCIAHRDVRYQDIYGQLREGEVAVFAPGADGKGGARILLKHDPDSGVSSVAVAVSPSVVASLSSEDGGTLQVAMEHGSIKWNSDGFTLNVKGKTILNLNADGKLWAIGTEFKAFASKVLLGNSATPASPVHYGPGSGMTSIPSTTVLVGV